MFTETELRDALNHSAERADDVTLTPGRPAGSPAPRRRYLLPVAAAASVLAIVGAALVVTRSGGTDQPAAAPPKSPALSSAVPRPDRGAVVDLFQVREPRKVSMQYGPAGNVDVGAQTGQLALGRVNAISLSVVPASAFDSSRIPRQRKVPIAGTTGYYSKLKLFPLDGARESGRDKYLAHWTIAFRTPAGDWAFAYFDNATPAGDPNSTDVSIDDPARIARAYTQLGVSFTPNASRLPFRLGYVPAGTKVSSVNTGDGDNVDVALVKGNRIISISVTDNLPPVARPINGPAPASRVVDGHRITVSGDEPTAQLKRVLDSLHLAADLGDRSTWFPLAKAIS